MSLCSLDVWRRMQALVMAGYGRVRLLTRLRVVLAGDLMLTACGFSYGQTAQALASRSTPSPQPCGADPPSARTAFI